MELETVFIEIPAAPPSVNTLWRKNPRGGMYLSQQARDFYALAKLVAGGDRVPNAWKFYAVDILVRPRRRSGDVDNYIKPVLDALTKAGVWSDDDRVARVSCSLGPIHKEGRALVRIREAPEKYETNEWP